jgi:hypothetical protein
MLVSDLKYRIYRAKILFALEKDLNDELSWLNEVSLKYLKNYQIWYVRSVRCLAIRKKRQHNEKKRDGKSKKGKSKLTLQLGTIAKS